MPIFGFEFSGKVDDRNQVKAGGKLGHIIYETDWINN